MSKRIIYKKGQVFGNFTIIEEVELKISKLWSNVRQFKIKCRCGKIVKKSPHNIKTHEYCGKQCSLKKKTIYKKGQVFGNFTMIGEIEPKIFKSGAIVRQFKVKCRCGKIVKKLTTTVKKDECCSKTCSIKSKYKVGVRIGPLVITKMLHANTANKERTMAEVKCDCGKTSIKLIANLNKKRFGCSIDCPLSPRSPIIIPNIGERYKKLTYIKDLSKEEAKERYSKETAARYFLVKCDCGREYPIQAYSWKRYGSCKVCCGHKISTDEFEKIIKKIKNLFNDNNIYSLPIPKNNYRFFYALIDLEYIVKIKKCKYMWIGGNVTEDDLKKIHHNITKKMPKGYIEDDSERKKSQKLFDLYLESLESQKKYKKLSTTFDKFAKVAKANFDKLVDRDNVQKKEIARLNKRIDDLSVNPKKGKEHKYDSQMINFIEHEAKSLYKNSVPIKLSSTNYLGYKAGPNEIHGNLTRWYMSFVKETNADISMSIFKNIFIDNLKYFKQKGWDIFTRLPRGVKSYSIKPIMEEIS